MTYRIERCSRSESDAGVVAVTGVRTGHTADRAGAGEAVDMSQSLACTSPGRNPPTCS